MLMESNGDLEVAKSSRAVRGNVLLETEGAHDLARAGHDSSRALRSKTRALEGSVRGFAWSRRERRRAHVLDDVRVSVDVFDCCTVGVRELSQDKPTSLQGEGRSSIMVRWRTKRDRI